MHGQKICTAQSRDGCSSWVGEMIHNMPGFADPSVGKRPSVEGSMGAKQEAERSDQL